MCQNIVHFIGTLAKESSVDKMSAEEKKIQGFSHVFYIWKFWKGPFWATWRSGGVGTRIVVVFIGVVFIVADLVSKEGGTMQKA
jgi:hypothetical protein